MNAVVFRGAYLLLDIALVLVLLGSRSSIVSAQIYSVVYNGNTYSTLAGIDISSSSSTCQSSYIAMPSGWQIAPDNTDTQTLIHMYPFSTDVVCTASGLSYGSSKYSQGLFSFSTSCFSVSGTSYAGTFCSLQILIVSTNAATSQPTLFPTFSPTAPPTLVPTPFPSAIPTPYPSVIPTANPSATSGSRWYTMYLYSDSLCQSQVEQLSYQDNICLPTTDGSSGYNSAMLIYDGSLLYSHLFTDSSCSEGDVVYTSPPWLYSIESIRGNLNSCIYSEGYSYYLTLTDSLPSPPSLTGTWYIITADSDCDADSATEYYSYWAQGYTTSFGCSDFTDGSTFGTSVSAHYSATSTSGPTLFVAAN